MNARKCDERDYVSFLIASTDVFTCTEAARCYPYDGDPPSHDAFTRLLQRQPPDTEALWEEVNDIVNPQDGFLVLDDTTLDKPYAKKMELVYRHWSGKHHRPVNGINMITLLWTDGCAIIPVDFRIYDINNDGKTKNDHFRDMLHRAKERGFQPKFVMFDSWYTSLDNLKTIRIFGWNWLTRLKSNRLVNPDNTKNVQINTVEIPPEGRTVHLKAYGFVKVFRIVSKKGDTEHWATDALDMEEPERKDLAKTSWKIEEYHRGIKQFCGVERCQARKAQFQRAHITFSLRAFLRLELQRLKTETSWFESKRAIIRNAIRHYINCPSYSLPTDSTA